MKWGGVSTSASIDFPASILDNGCCEIHQGCDDGIHFLTSSRCEMGNSSLAQAEQEIERKVTRNRICGTSLCITVVGVRIEAQKD